jgi:hypothetical protein
MNLIAEVPIFLLCVDGSAACAQTCRVTTLHHEALDDTVEEGVVVVACLCVRVYVWVGGWVGGWVDGQIMGRRGDRGAGVCVCVCAGRWGAG